MPLRRCELGFTLRLHRWHKIGVALLSAVLSGCVTTALDKTVNRAIAIEMRCTAIQQAVPVEEKQLERALFDAVAQRLVGTCLEGDQLCVNPSGAAQTPQDLAAAVTKVRNTLKNSLVVLNSSIQPGKDIINEAKALTLSYNLAIKEVEERSKAVNDARDELLKELRGARDALRADQTLLLKQCGKRTDCVILFAKLIRQSETRIIERATQLQASIRRLAESGELIKSLKAPTSLLVLKAAVPADGFLLQLTEEKNKLRNDSDALVSASMQLGTRVVNGMRSLRRLLSDDVESAATDLMAAKLYGKIANRTLVLIDGMLAQLDHTIDKIDNQLYGGATMVVQLYSGEMQERFDRIFLQLVAENFKSRTAKLAFADAACQRLGLGEVPGKDSKSMFSPFLYATLINLQLDLGDEKAGSYTPAERAEKLSQKRSADDAPEKSLENALSVKAELTKSAARALQQDAEADRAPSMLQQVATCATVEQQLSLSTQARADDIRLATNGVCAYKAMSAARDLTSISDPASAATGQAAIAAAAKETPVLAANDATAAKAWSLAMEKVLASIPKAPVQEDRLCGRLEARTPDVLCEEAKGKVTLDFGTSFAIGKSSDRTLELSLASLADVLNAQPRRYQLWIEGYASRSAAACPKDLSVKETPCGDKKNQLLASDRAKWAAGVLQRRLLAGGDMLIDSAGFNNPLSFDTPADRRIRVVIRPAGSETTAMPIAAGQ